MGPSLFQAPIFGTGVLSGAFSVVAGEKNRENTECAHVGPLLPAISRPLLLPGLGELPGVNSFIVLIICFQTEKNGIIAIGLSSSSS